MIELWDGKLDLEPLASAWSQEVPGYSIEKGLSDLALMRDEPHSDVLVLMWQGLPVGGMGIQVLDMFFTSESYAAVRYWYILPKFRSLAKQFVSAAKHWARGKGCEKLLVCSSGLCRASDDFWKLMDFGYFETVYVGDV